MKSAPCPLSCHQFHACSAPFSIPAMRCSPFALPYNRPASSITLVEFSPILTGSRWLCTAEVQERMSCQNTSPLCVSAFPAPGAPRDEVKEGRLR